MDDVILLHSNQRQVSATYVAIFRVVRIRIRSQLCVGINPQFKKSLSTEKWFTVQFVSSLTNLDLTIYIYLLCTSSIELYSIYNFFCLQIVYIHLYFSLSTLNLTNIFMIFKCRVKPTYYNCNCILVLATQQFAT